MAIYKSGGFSVSGDDYPEKGTFVDRKGNKHELPKGGTWTRYEDADAPKGLEPVTRLPDPPSKTGSKVEIIPPVKKD